MSTIGQKNGTSDDCIESSDDDDSDKSNVNRYPTIPSLSTLFTKFITNDIIRNKNFYFWVIFFAATFRISHSIVKHVFYPSLHRLAVSIISSMNGNNNNMKSMPMVSSLRIAKNTARCTSFAHALLGVIAAKYFFTKYKRMQKHVLHPMKTKYHNDELKALDMTTAYFVVDSYLVWKFDPEPSFVLHHCAALCLCFGLYATRRSAVGHNWLIFTGELPTLLLNVLTFTEEALSYLKSACLNGNVNWEHALVQNRTLRRLKIFHRICSVLFALLFCYCRVFEWNDKLPTILKNTYKDSRELGVHSFVKWCWICGLSTSSVLSLIWSVFIVRKAILVGIKGRNLYKL